MPRLCAKAHRRKHRFWGRLGLESWEVEILAFYLLFQIKSTKIKQKSETFKPRFFIIYNPKLFYQFQSFAIR